MKRIAFIGAPNVGKSSLFARLSGAYTPIGNWAGLTVSANQAKVPWDGQIIELVDLPGFYGLSGGGADEQLAQAMLHQSHADLWVVVLHASQLPRQLNLLNELLTQPLPMVIVLNQLDDATRLGIHLDTDVLTKYLQRPVIAVSSKACIGLDTLKQTLIHALKKPTEGHHLPQHITLDQLQEGWQAPKILADNVSEQLDHWLLHPWFGIPIFIIMMTLLFQVVFWLGGWAQAWVAMSLSYVADAWLMPSLSALPNWASAFIRDGVYEGIATLISFVPLVALFFWLLALLTDSGYLARMAFLADNLMAKFGLEGRSLVLTVMGMGCNVPAVLGARIIPNRGMRLLTQLTLPFALCSARFQVFIFFAASLFAPWQAAFVIMGLYALSIAAALFTAWIGRRAMPHFDVAEPTIFEMPSYRLPSWSQALQSAKYEVIAFLRRASGLIILGIMVVWLLLHLPWGSDVGGIDSYAGMLGHFLSPIFTPMGLPDLYVVALLFGIVAKEVVLGGLMLLMGIAQSTSNSETQLSEAIINSLPPESALALMVFILLYTPCLATLAVLKQEGGWRLMLGSLVWSLVFAWLLATLTFQLARLTMG
jgi:ferrous iron transport protein B